MSRLKLRAVNVTEQLLKRQRLITGENYLQLNRGDNRRFILIKAIMDEGPLSLYCDAIGLLTSCLEKPADLPVDIIADDVLIGLVKRYFDCQKLYPPFSLKNVENYTVCEFVDSGTPKYPLISGSCGKGIVWAAIDDLTLPKPPKVANSADWRNIMLSVQISLGLTTVSHRDLMALRVGDVLVVAQQNCKAIIANKKSIKLHFDGENMIVENMDGSEFSSDEDQLHQTDNEVISLENLDINVEFIIHQEAMTLEALQCMQINDLLTLNTSNSQVNVCLRVGQHIVASGELVSVNEKLAVEIQKINGSMRS